MPAFVKSIPTFNFGHCLYRGAHRGIPWFQPLLHSFQSYWKVLTVRMVRNQRVSSLDIQALKLLPGTLPVQTPSSPTCSFLCVSIDNFILFTVYITLVSLYSHNRLMSQQKTVWKKCRLHSLTCLFPFILQGNWSPCCLCIAMIQTRVFSISVSYYFLGPHQ